VSWRRDVLLGVQRFFPAYFPGLLIVIKWTVRRVFDRYVLANTIVDVPFASLSFAVWVVLRQNLNPPQWPTADALATGKGTFRRL
jgi:hypothetical protein